MVWVLEQEEGAEGGVVLTSQIVAQLTSGTKIHHCKDYGVFLWVDWEYVLHQEIKDNRRGGRSGRWGRRIRKKKENENLLCAFRVRSVMEM